LKIYDFKAFYCGIKNLNLGELYNKTFYGVFVDYLSKFKAGEKGKKLLKIKNAFEKWLVNTYARFITPMMKKRKKSFQQINELMEVLSDPESRKKYDKFGKDWPNMPMPFWNAEAAQRIQSKPTQLWSQGSNERDFLIFFESMFGGNK